jgi:hypothetical protein
MIAPIEALRAFVTRARALNNRLESWPREVRLHEPRVLITPSMLDKPRRARVIETMLLIEKTHTAGQQSRARERALERENRRLAGQVHELRLQLEAVQKLIMEAQPAAPPEPVKPPLPPRDLYQPEPPPPARGRKVGTSPVLQDALSRLMSRPPPEPGSFEPGEEG